MTTRVALRRRVAWLDRLAADALPVRETHLDDGWRLRSDDGGHVRRANSVAPFDAGRDDLDRKLARVEAWYRERGLRPRLQLSPASAPIGLAAALRARRWSFEVPVAVMVAGAGRPGGAPPSARAAEGTVLLVDHAVPEWRAGYRRTLAPEGAGDAEARLRLAAHAPAPAAYAIALDGAGALVAVGAAVAAEGWTGIFDVGTVPEARRRGHAARVMAALAAWGAGAAGSERRYLQVALANRGARSLYARLGYRSAYGYVYAVGSLERQ